ncbi:MAG: Jag N-terminal domain-containing protein [Candidatus Edwardsbacteria bacterium]|nr:Jag N-terminal domain-containing protein [Candidatus Edwardsbacteria bacterium]
MNIVIEKEGKTVEEAIEKGLALLKAQREEVQIEIISLGSPGFLGLFFAKAAKVRLRIMAQPRIRGLVEAILDKMGMPGSVRAFREEGESLLVSIESELGDKYLKDRRGAALEAMEYLINKIFRESDQDIQLDIGGFRQDQTENLKVRALDIAAKVKETGREIALEPMPSHQRKMVHQALQNHPDVRTFAVGKDDRRKVIIAPKGSGPAEGARPPREGNRPEGPRPNGPRPDERKPDPRGPRRDGGRDGGKPGAKPGQPPRPPQGAKPAGPRPAQPARPPQTQPPRQQTAAPKPQQPGAPGDKKFNDRARRPAPKPVAKPANPAPRPPAEKPLTDAEKLFAPRAKKRRR